jgi:multidrug efflux pump subunit AcrB/ABC-type multidrug transport system ATPase subunit
MNMFKFIIHRKTFVSMLFIGLTLLGYISYSQLPIEIFPNAEMPQLIVNINTSSDLSPDNMEKEAVLQVEGKISTLEGIDSIETSVQRGRATINIYFNQNVNINYAYLKLFEKVNELKSTLSEDFNLSVTKVDMQRLSNSFMTLQVRGSGGLERIRTIIDEEIEAEFQNIDGVANVQVIGGNVKAVEIMLEENAYLEHGITPGRVRQLISQNAESTTFLGNVYENNKPFFVNLTAEYTDIRNLENMVIVQEGPILLKDVASVNFGSKDETEINRVNGKEAISILLIRDSQTNLIKLSHVALGVIEELNNRFRSQDIEIVIQSNSAEDIETNINLIKKLALLGGLFAVIILWFFLKNLRLVMIMMFAIPISIFTAFNFFYAYDITINSLTLVGIALAVGMLLDNSVVVMENIYRLASTHKDADTAVIQGTTEVWRAIFASTLTTVTVFLPFIFSSDFLVRLIGRHIGVSIISTLLVSLVVALVLVPMVAHFFLKNGSRGKGKNSFNFNKVSQKNRLYQIYNLLLKSCMRFPARSMIGAVLVFFISLLVCLAISRDVPEEIEETQFKMYVTMPRGATLETTDTVVSDLEERLAGIEEVEDLISQIYEDEAVLTFDLYEDFEEIDNRTISQIKNEAEERVERYRLASISMSEPQASARFGGGMGGNPMANLSRMFGIGTSQEKVVVKGTDFDMLRIVADDIKYNLDNLDSVSGEARLDIQGNTPEVHVLFDTRLLSILNIPISSIQSELSTLQGEYSSNIKFKQDNNEYDIIIREQDYEDEKTFAELKELQIPDPSGTKYELDNLSRIVYSYGKSGIKRINQEKQIEISFRFEDEITDSKSILEISRDEVDQLIASLLIPSGIAVEVINDESEIDEFYFLFAVAILLIYMILASVFESLTTPLVMMFIIPLAAIGSFWALIITGNSILNANSLVGLLILVGVVVNNGIILIDYTRVLRSRGYNRSRALMMAGQARVRPILITAITTMVALVPLGMGNTELVSRIGAPFAIAVIGGLALSTLFTLVLIPTVYSGLESSIEWMKKLSLKLKLIQLVLFIAGCALIYYYINSLLWQIANLVVLIVLIPGATYFLMVNLRQAQSDYIGKDESLTIKIRRIVKIYDDYSRFVREWRKADRMEALYGPAKDYRGWRDFDNFRWQIPLLAFLVYFAYYYLANHFWTFVVAHIIYFYLFMLITPIRILLSNRAESLSRPLLSRLGNVLNSILLWGFPFANLVIFYFMDFKTEVIVFITIFWYSTLIIYTTSARLHEGKVNIMRLSGKFSGFRRHFYQFVQLIPVIGKRKNPFNALDGVSIQIESGMFGLLGPNGAGKTTIMRTICGILNQSMGTIQINEIDFKEKREELQGLIGYLPQEFGTYENMTAYEFLDYIAILKNIYDKTERDRIVNQVISSVHLEETQDKKIGSFSGGMKQRVGIAMTLLHLPRILVVDEPTAGLDPRERIRFRNLLVELSSERIVIFSTHIIEDVSSSCNKVAVFNRGKLHYFGEPANMIKAAEGKVWQFNVSFRDFENIQNKLRIVHHMQADNMIRVRCISETEPYQDAVQVHPTLEDAYLVLLGDNLTHS